MNTSIVSTILKKASWQTKIHDNDICLKWIREFSEQGACNLGTGVAGADHNIVSNIIDILRNHSSYIYKSNNGISEVELEYYDWFTDTTFSLPYIKCKCDCLICDGREYAINNPDFDEDGNSIHESNDSDESDEENQETSIPIDNGSNGPTRTHWSQCKCLNECNKTLDNLLKSNVKSLNNLIDGELKEQFISCIECYDKSDKHPNTNNMVSDIIHPSLYSYVKGMTRLNLNCNTEITEIDKNMVFQWLPANVFVERDNNGLIKTSFTSPINGIPFVGDVNNNDNKTDTDRENITTQLYESIEQIFSKFVPHFESCINKLIKDGMVESLTNPFQLNDCQVIVKVQEINLDKQHPLFDEGSWHLEGTIYERIIATGIYYYQMENIKDNQLNFRVKLPTDFEYDLNYPQNCHQYVEHHYGIDEDSGSNLYIGNVQTKEDLCLVFPNNFQHKVSSIKLNDKTKIGSRKILVFFLIDPSQKILSTADVEPQHEYIDYETACINRQLLMFDRKYEQTKQNCVYEREFSLCEH
jgi:hypothetical protein